MHKISVFIIFFTFSIFLGAKNLYAITDPLSVPNNKYGIHIINENDLEEARVLVNSTGGEWGYVTVVIRSDERNIDRWQRAFDDMREKKLIPIVRIATRQTTDGWEKFSHEDIKNWIYFLNSLNWVVKNRYIIVGNEPNHATEWGGEVNPEEYSDFLHDFSRQLKSASDDFFIIPAGFDASAPNADNYMSEDIYLKRMLNKNPDLFDNIDGWSSHSYPNPDFSGSTDDTGRGSIRTYEWESDYLRSLGVSKKLPIFITETGWAHNQNSSTNTLLHPQYLGENYKIAFERVWQDERIVAITPFVLNYQQNPFNVFSWKTSDGSYYDFYYDVQTLSKHKGTPLQTNTASIKDVILPSNFNQRQNITGYAIVENTGQVIWEKEEVKLVFESNIGHFLTSASNIERVKPGDKTAIFFQIQTTEITRPEIRVIVNIAMNAKVISQGFRLTYFTNLNSTKNVQGYQTEKPKFEATSVMLPIVLFQQSDDITSSI